MWVWSKIEGVKCIERKSNEEVLMRLKENRILLIWYWRGREIEIGW